MVPCESEDEDTELRD